MDPSRLIRDLNDGILVLNSSGTIVETNPSAEQLLGFSESLCGHKYSELMLLNQCEQNDDFHQMLLDSLTDKASVLSRSVAYVRPDGRRMVFQMHSSVWHDDNNDRCGAILSFSDITEQEKLRMKNQYSTEAFVLLLCAVSLWNFFYSFWDYAGQPIGDTIISKILVLVVLFPSLLFVRKYHMTPEDMGLRTRGIRKIIYTDIIITVAALGLMVLVKFIILQSGSSFFPAGKPFFNMRKYPAMEWILYSLSVLGQEFISRGVVHESMRRIMPGRHHELWAIVVSSVVFGALHLHLGVIYMCGAALLLGVLGIIYIRQGTIWGLCIPHYVLGMFIGLLDFVVY